MQDVIYIRITTNFIKANVIPIKFKASQTVY